MKNKTTKLMALLVLLLPIVGVGPLSQAQTASNWGMEFPTSQSGVAQEHFLEGVTYMHLHMFEDAEEQFRAAQAAAPDFAMAYWGEALNNHRTIWNIHRPEAAREILNRLGANVEERAAKAPTEREKAYLMSVEILFSQRDLRERRAAYAEAMRQISERYPDDTEAKAWYALSLMRETPPDMTRQQTRSLMASLSLEVLARNPRHPGANRYLIQSTDDPENTDIGVIAVNNLRLVDTDAAEALHIPSHYYVQHGMWSEVAESNMKAFDASMSWVDDHGWSLEDLNSHNYGHLLQFANYGYLQSGMISKAESIRNRIYSDFLASNQAAEIAVPLADTFARMIIDLEQWSSAADLVEDVRNFNIRQPSIWLAIGLGAVRSGNLDLAEEALAILSDSADGSASVGSIAALQIDGILRISEGSTRQGLSLLNDAVKLSAQMNVQNPVTLIGSPPRPVKPALELYGEALLETGSAALALEQFQQGLKLYHGRTNLLLGAARAATASGDTIDAYRYYERLSKIWSAAEETHPFTAEVRAALVQ